jgi:hypothetical protein
VLSQWVDINGAEQGPAAVALELDDGRRLGLLPFEPVGVAHPLLCLPRREQWTALFEWVGRRPLPCRVLAGVNLYPQLLVSPEGEEALLAVVNLSADDSRGRLAVADWARPRAAWRLSPGGQWTEDPTPLDLAVPAWSVGVWRWQLGGS